MGRVEIIFHDILLPVYFLIPPMCQVFSHVPLGKMWEKCLPRDESTLVQYQYESMRIFDMMKQERLLLRVGGSKFFGKFSLFVFFYFRHTFFVANLLIFFSPTRYWQIGFYGTSVFFHGVVN